MNDPIGTLALSAALLAGVASSGHCFAMCGGFAGALAMRSRHPGSPSAMRDALACQLGRIGGYAVAGGLCGLFGATLTAMLDPGKVGGGLRFASGVLIVLVALRILCGWNTLAPIERLGARFWKSLRPLAQHVMKGEGTWRQLGFGFLWGWLPCGLVYSMLLFAALGADAARGMLLMVAFGLGTLPSMVASSLVASTIHRRLSSRWPRMATGTLLLLFGTSLSVAAVRSAHPDASPDHQHCDTHVRSLTRVAEP